MSANQIPPRPVVHLELHTPDQVRASAFYAKLLYWRPEVLRAAAGSYLALDTGAHLGGGIVECCTRRPLWLPYVEVDRVDRLTERARELGAVVLLEPREGPDGLPKLAVLRDRAQEGISTAVDVDRARPTADRRGDER